MRNEPSQTFWVSSNSGSTILYTNEMKYSMTTGMTKNSTKDRYRHTHVALVELGRQRG